MTRKDSELIASTISALNEIVDEQALETNQQVFAAAPRETNKRVHTSRFDHARGGN